MLSISKKLFRSINFNERDNKIVLVKSEKGSKLTIKKIADIRKGMETDLEKISQKINESEKPKFESIESFIKLNQNLKTINEKIKKRNCLLKIILIYIPTKLTTITKHLKPRLNKKIYKTIRFIPKYIHAFLSKKSTIKISDFNCNLKPLSTELEEKVWAVHATKVLPENGILKPSIRKRFGEGAVEGVSPTLHFALGGLVRSHGADVGENTPYAVITPLKTILDKTINLFVYDTFILHDWKLAPESILIVPKGTDHSSLSTRVVEYDSCTTTLREAIDEQISKAQGLLFDTQNNSPYVGKKATINGDININTPEFFNTLINKNISFGDHTHSEIGHAALFGLIRQLTTTISAMTDDNQTYAYFCTLEFYLKKLIEYYPNEKETQEELKKFLDKWKEKIKPSTFNDYYFGHDLMSSFKQSERDEFIKSYPDLFPEKYRNLNQIMWGIARWLNVGETQAKKENLQQLIQDSINNFFESLDFLIRSTNTIKELLRFNINLFSEIDNTKLDILIKILNLPEFKKLNEEIEILCFYDSLKSAKDILKVHPATSYYFESNCSMSKSIESLNSKNKDVLDLCLAFRPIPLITDNETVKNSYVLTCEAYDFDRYENKIIELFNSPLKSGSTNVYKQFYPNPTYMWRKLGLGKEYSLLFKDPNDFWNSPKSLVEIYQELKALKT